MLGRRSRSARRTSTRRPAAATTGRFFTNGEEVDDVGRAFAWIVGGPEHGRAYHLPHLGQFAYENVVANPGSGDKTITVALDDVSEGQVYVYVGQKSSTGNPVERAGLHGGKLYGIRVTNGGVNYGTRRCRWRTRARSRARSTWST